MKVYQEKGLNLCCFFLWRFKRVPVFMAGTFVIFAGSMTVVSLQNGLKTLENRLGADIIVVPNTAKRKVDPKTMILDGTPGYFYMEREKMTLISHIEGVEKVSPQIFLASLSASCCSVPVQIIGFEPETDFII